MSETVLIIRKYDGDNEKIYNAFTSNFYKLEPIIITNNIPQCDRKETIESICKSVNPDILIGELGAEEFVEPIQFYKRKYLVNPKLKRKPLPYIRDYDRENTIGLFGGSDIERDFQWIFSHHYPKSITFSYYEAMALPDIVRTIIAIHSII